jgi:hypothetical protein
MIALSFKLINCYLIANGSQKNDPWQRRLIAAGLLRRPPIDSEIYVVGDGGFFRRQNVQLKICARVFVQTQP